MISLDEKLRRLTEVVTLLSAEPNEQLAAFPEWTVRVEEIALTSHDCFLFAKELRDSAKLSDTEFREIRAIHAKFDEMSGPSNVGLWTEQALANHPDWHWIRTKARRLLELLQVRERKPQLDWITYVRD